MSTGTLTPFPEYFALDNNGLPLAGGLLYTYASGTSTLLATYSDAALTTPHTNPIVLNSAGRSATPIYLSPLSYKFIQQDANAVVLWTVDPVPSTGLLQSAVGVGGTLWNFGGSEYTPVTNTTYSAGTTADMCHADCSFLLIDSALLVGTFVLTGMLEGQSSITMTAALVNLSDGSPATPLIEISSTSTTGAPVTSTPISFAAPGVAKTYAIKVKVSSGIGFAWGVSLVRSA